MKYHLKFIILVVSLLVPNISFSWGGHGHDMLCEAATHLVQDKELKEFLTYRSHIMGHLCNIPDTYWRSLGSISESGNSTHFFEPDLVGESIKNTPTNYAKVIKQYQGKANLFKEGATVFSVPKEMGSSWWRAEQFGKLTIEAAKKAKKSKAPSNKQEEQNYDFEYNQGVYDMMVAMGLQGHFAGDVVQPFHNTADYDGWKKNHGGIHGYFEEVIVGVLPATTLSQIVDEAEKNRAQYKFLKTKSIVEAMQIAADLSYSEIETVIELDQVKKPSERKSEKGMDIKVPAQRESAYVMAPKFQPLIVKEMARGAALLAHLWDTAYERSGKPSLKEYKSYRFPFTPDFIAPDYYKEEIKK